MLKKKYKAIFLIKEQNSYTIVYQKTFNPTIETINFKKESFPIDISTYTFTKGLTSFYCFNIKNKNQIVFQNSKNPSIDTKTINKMLEQNIIGQLTSDLTNSSFKTTIFNIIIGLLIGGLFGYIFGGIV